MDYRDEIGGYTPEENRAPWELTPAQARRERRSCRKVDDFGASARCSVLEENKRASAEGRARRLEEQWQRRAQDEERKRATRARLESLRREKQEQARRAAQTPPDGETPPPADDEAAASAPPIQAERLSWKAPTRAERIHTVILIVLVTVSLGVIGFTVFNFLTLRETILAASGDDDDFYYYYDDGDTEENAAEEDYELEHYAGDSTGLSVTLVSQEGKRALTYQELYEQCRPSVVSISVTAGLSGSTGSGIILTEDGYILTCDHVIDNAERCTVITSDDTRYQAKLVGTDPQTDLAVLKIEATGLTPAEFGVSDELTVGDEALVIGDPLGETFRATLTNGIISGVNRKVTSNNYSMTLIQTTAAVNGGNSGGALFNIYGQVVGVVNLKMVQSSSSEATVEGMGMAVPSSTVQSIVPVLAEEGTVHRPVLGITCSSINEETAARYDGIPTGLLVQSVNELADCYAQGLEVYDIITEADGVAVTTVEEFKEVIADLEIGDTVTLTVYRDANQVFAAQYAAENGGSSASDTVPETYDYQYYDTITVTLMDSIDMAQ